MPKKFAPGIKSPSSSTDEGIVRFDGTTGKVAQDSGVTIDDSNNVLVPDDALFRLGATADQVLLNRSTTLAANTALTNVLIGTPVSQALAANSLMVSNVTASGDIGLYVNKGGHSQMVFFADGSAGDTAIMAASGQSVDVYIAGTKEIDYATGAMAFQQATTISTSTGALTIDGDDGITLQTTGSGNVTINETVDLDGDISFQGAQTISTTSGDLTITPSSSLVVTRPIEVGIATTLLGHNAEITVDTGQGSSNNFSAGLLIAGSRTSNNVTTAALNFANWADSATRTIIASVAAHREANDDDGSMTFSTTPTAGSLTKRWRITSAGVLQAEAAQSITTVSGNLTLNPAGEITASKTINMGDYLGLFKTDTDSAVEGELWYDDSENKLKFYDGGAVRTVTST